MPHVIELQFHKAGSCVKKWQKAIGQVREDFEVVENTVVCSNHFR